jgi:hypothetical protein
LIANNTILQLALKRGIKMEILDNEFFRKHAQLVIKSFENLTQTVFPVSHQSNLSTPQDLFNSDYCILSHGLGDTPIFNFKSKTK